MNARLNSLCVGSLLAIGASAAHAQTQVTLYGYAAVEMVHATNVAQNGSIGTANLLEDSRVTNSRLGFKGSEDLGGGFSAVFGLEARVLLDNGGSAGNTFWNRGASVGFASKQYGTLTFGRQWNVNDDIMANYFVFDGYSAFSLSEFDYLSDLVVNSAKYVSPDIYGFTVRGLVAPGEGVTGRTYEVAVQYTLGGLNVGASYRNAKGANQKTDKLTSGGISYTIGDFRPHIGYSVSDSQASGGTGGPNRTDPLSPGLPKAKAWDVGVSYAPTPVLLFDVDYVGRDQVDTSNDSHFFRVQAQYFLSKRTSFLANVVALKNKGTASEHFYGDGAAGKDQSVFSLGLRHMF